MPEPSSNAAKKLGDRIRTERNRQALSQEDVAHLAGMNVSNYGKIERGLGNPTFETVVRIAAALGTDPGELVKGISGNQLPPLNPAFSIRDWVNEKRAHGKQP